MSKVDSYVRFSSKAQEFGDSQRRQAANARKYCEKDGRVLEKTRLKTLASAGGNERTSGRANSAFSGKPSTMVQADLLKYPWCGRGRR